MAVRNQNVPVDVTPTLDAFVDAVKKAGVQLVKLDERASVIPKVSGKTVVAQPYAVYIATAYDNQKKRIIKLEEKEAVGRGILSPDGTFQKTSDSLVSRLDEIAARLESEGVLITGGNWEKEGVPVT